MLPKNEKGQAIVILAMVIVVLLMFAVLAIDAGNAYNEKRLAQNAADAAALGGARQLALECAKTTGSNEANIRNSVLQMMNYNNPNSTVKATFINSDGTETKCAVGSCGTVACGCPKRMVGVDVVITGTTPSFFAGLFGQTTLSTLASARARYGPVVNISTGLYPFTRKIPTPDDPIVFGQRVALRTYDATFGCDNGGKKNKCGICEAGQSGPAGNFGWLTWDGRNGVPDLVKSLTPPGDSYTYVNPGVPDKDCNFPKDGGDPNDHVINAGIGPAGDWIDGLPGNKNAKDVREQLDWFIATKTPMVIPLYDQVLGQGNNAYIHAAAFAAFELLCYNFAGAGSGSGGNCTLSGTPDKGKKEKIMEGKFLRWVVPDGEWGDISCSDDMGIWTVKLIP